MFKGEFYYPLKLKSPVGQYQVVQVCQRPSICRCSTSWHLLLPHIAPHQIQHLHHVVKGRDAGCPEQHPDETASVREERVAVVHQVGLSHCLVGGGGESPNQHR